MTSHKRIVVVDDAKNWIAEECAQFPYGAHDDQVDAMTQALLRWHEVPKQQTYVFIPRHRSNQPNLSGPGGDARLCRSPTHIGLLAWRSGWVLRAHPAYNRPELQRSM